MSHRSLTFFFLLFLKVFSPLETFDDPLICELLYRQILFDTFSSKSSRIFDEERRKIVEFFASHNVKSIDDHNRIDEISVKKTIVEKARRWSIYFSRLFPISSSRFFGISHDAIQLVDENDEISVDVVPFRSIERISSIENERILTIFSTKKTFSISSKEIRRIKSMLDEFLREFRTTNDEIVVSSASQSPTNHSMMEFAVQNFQIPKKSVGKKSLLASDWTWQDYSLMIKWSKVSRTITRQDEQRFDSFRFRYKRHFFDVYRIVWLDHRFSVRSSSSSSSSS